MRYFNITWLCFRLLTSVLSAQAQLGSSNLNLTLIFSAENQSTCSTSNSTSGLIFTTASVPVAQHCFNIGDLFLGNQTQGFVNQTNNTRTSILRDEPAGIYWSLTGLDEYDTNTNYSHVWYRLHDPNPSGNDDYKSNAYADRRVNIYPGLDCTDAVSSDSGSSASLRPWYSWSCWSEDEGSCGVVPYSVASFYILPLDDDDKKGTCMTFAKAGLGSGRPSAAFWVVMTAIFSLTMTL